MNLIYANEESPNTINKSIFLGGATSRNPKEIASWRPEAIKYLEEQGFTGTVFIPENRDVNKPYDYDAQIEWEEEHLNMADCILFWIPRDLTLDSEGQLKMPAFTSNIEWGAWCDSGKVVLGYPKDAPKMNYFNTYADKYNVPISNSLQETIQSAIDKLGDGADRHDGERYIPLYIWNTPSFQSWYSNLQQAGNRLDNAKVLYTFRPRYKDFVFLWILHVKVWIETEQRYKTNEFVLSRTNIASVCLWYNDEDNESIFDTKVVLIKEFQSNASTQDGFIRELPSGSSSKATSDMGEIAIDEVFEETGLRLDSDKLYFVNERQLAGTFSAHKSYLYSYKLSEEEYKWCQSQKDIPHGNIEDSEKTYIEIYSIQELINQPMTDWATLGSILAVMGSE